MKLPIKLPDSTINNLRFLQEKEKSLNCDNFYSKSFENPLWMRLFHHRAWRHANSNNIGKGVEGRKSRGVRFGWKGSAMDKGPGNLIWSNKLEKLYNGENGWHEKDNTFILYRYYVRSTVWEKSICTVTAQLSKCGQTDDIYDSQGEGEHEELVFDNNDWTQRKNPNTLNINLLEKYSFLLRTFWEPLTWCSHEIRMIEAFECISRRVGGGCTVLKAKPYCFERKFQWAFVFVCKII